MLFYLPAAHFILFVPKVLPICHIGPIVARPTVDYPTVDYPTVDYPTVDYPTVDYPTVALSPTCPTSTHAHAHAHARKVTI